MIREKNQIRPRSFRVRLNNAEIIAASSDARLVTLETFPPDQIAIFTAICIRTHIVQVYGLAAAAQNPYLNVRFFNGDAVEFIDDYPGDMSGNPQTLNLTILFGQTGDNALFAVCPPQIGGSLFGYQEPLWNDTSGILPQVNMFTQLVNPGGPFTGGDSDNFLEYIGYYYLVNA